MHGSGAVRGHLSPKCHHVAVDGTTLRLQGQGEPVWRWFRFLSLWLWAVYGRGTVDLGLGAETSLQGRREGKRREYRELSSIQGFSLGEDVVLR